jgi:hypothetical protein
MISHREHPGEEQAIDPRAFRAELEYILRQKRPEALRQFMVEQEQWPADSSGK